MIFDPFVLPFLIGLLVMMAILLEKYVRWLKDLTREEWLRVVRGVFSLRIFKAVREIILECLIHRKIFRQNFLLGYMHMSFALGWLVLIVAGAMESKFFTHGSFEPPYFPIFFNFFVHNKQVMLHHETFGFLMDFLLAVILSGLLLALIKRVYGRIFGMRKTTKFELGNKLALITLWAIFPLRLIAESITSSLYGNGGFLTGTLGNYISANMPAAAGMELTAWWAYSIALGTFFVVLPYSRYMHIPTEVLLIILRNFGIKNKKVFNGFSQIEVNSCPRCGLCIDVCQLNNLFDNEKIVPSYYLKSIRDKRVREQVTFDCLMCGKCKEYCPVGIDTLAQRSLQREKFISNGVALDFLKEPENVAKADIAYFAGCMTHLTPSIKKSVLQVLEAAGKKYTFIDAEGGACCGRPQILAGNYSMADKLMEHTKKSIIKSKARILLVSCPICYKVFKDDYKLDIEVLHHSEYFARLVDTAKLDIKKLDKTVVYHDPCELGRGEGIYKQPRNILRNIATLKKTRNDKRKSLCCGGSLGIFEISDEKRNIVRDDALKSLTEPKPDYIVTSCPLCKKTFANGTDTEVKDIAEMILISMKN